jgi:lipopolysaccharide/colanic/teichoic acid biosynthesis glycosyltransferase
MSFHDIGADLDAGLAARPAVQGFYARRLKRGLDLALVLLAAPFVLPLIALMALLVALDGGPAFYGQTRVGRGGARFTCWKLRSMAVDADARLAAVLQADPGAAAEWARCQKLRRDPRVTPLGRFLRACSLDELPQLWNVFTGDMSLVGPRPMTPEQVSMYPAGAYREAYCAVRPGLTGFWQVSERHEGAFAARAGFDSRYAEEVSPATDAALLARTVGVVLRGAGA